MICHHSSLCTDGSNIPNRTVYKIVKRLSDLIVASAATVVLLPLGTFISIILVLSNDGRVFYAHKRIGYHGQAITVYKFRTMVHGADNLEESLTDQQLEEFLKEYKLVDDPRITRFGAFLRKWSLDELPQLINIIQGRLSLVGPRPLVQDEYLNYTEEQAAELQSVKPGLTGYWQAYARNEAGYNNGDRQRMELYYVENASVLFDIRIILHTFAAVLKRRGAH